MTIGIIGSGLIGGSVARAYKSDGHTVLIKDKDTATLGYALLSGIADGELTTERLSECDITFIALYPDAAIAFL